MAANFTVTPELLEGQASKVEGLNAQYVQLFGRIYTERDNMKKAWSGEANQAYCDRLEGFRNDFENLKALLTNYVAYIRQSAKTYREKETQLKDQASQLTAGR